MKSLSEQREEEEKGLPGLWKSVYFLINCVIQTGIVQSAHERLNEVHCPGTGQCLVHVCTCVSGEREGREKEKSQRNVLCVQTMMKKALNGRLEVKKLEKNDDDFQ